MKCHIYSVLTSLREVSADIEFSRSLKALSKLKTVRVAAYRCSILIMSLQELTAKKHDEEILEKRAAYSVSDGNDLCH